jgi:hypothetical protein
MLVQPIEPGSTVPAHFASDGLFLLNFGPILANDVWDDYGHKENQQAEKLKQLAMIIQSMADDLADFGTILLSYPDPNDLDEDVYEETWPAIAHELDDTFEKGYAAMAEHLGKLTEAAAGDFMD